ncbi:MAG TPA: serpin family protein [Nocardioides sp.]|nr:serpin family protein [Nocardioides sp.]
MDLSRRQSLQLLLALSAALAVPGVAACGADRRVGGAPRDTRELELASSEVERSPGSAAAIPDAVASVGGLAAGLYGALAREPGNLVFSPYSVAVALAMTLNGARGRTATEMRDVLATADTHRLDDGLDALTLHLEGLAGPTRRVDGSGATIALDAANALFGQRGTAWEGPFLDDLARYFGAGMRLVDYATATEAARTLINEWTAEQTHDRIPEIVPAGILSDLTRLVLVNAIYLKAPWETPFDPDTTADRPFHADAGTRDVPTMTAGLHLSGHARGDGWEAVRLPYAGGALAMTVVLPDEGALARVSAALAGGALPSILAAPRPTPVQLSLPRWTFRTEAPLGDVLTALGMPTAFDPARADFTAMTRQEQLFIAAVLHEGFIAVDEAGTEAAAATAVVMDTTSAPLYREVVVDRPFLFVVHDVEHLTPLFVGRVSDPTV